MPTPRPFRVWVAVVIVILVGVSALLYTSPNLVLPHKSTSVSYPLTVVDDLGRNITISKPPQRIVSLIPSATQIVFAIGAGQKVVGATRYDDYPPELVDEISNRTVANVGGGFDPDIEKIIQLNPDLILADGPGHIATQSLQKLQDLGYVTLALDPKSIEGVLHDIRTVGMILGYLANAEKVVEDIQKSVDSVHEITKNAARPSVYIENWHDPLITAGNGTLQNQMVELAGGKNIFSDLHGYQIGSEAVIARNPDIIISFDYFETVDQIKLRPGWASIKAVLENRVYQMNAEEGAPNPRIGQSLLKMAKLIHPELFAQQVSSQVIFVQVMAHRSDKRRIQTLTRR